MYSRVVRPVFNTSIKFSKRKINQGIEFVFPTSLTLTKLLASCTSQCSVQNYSSGTESLNEKGSDKDLARERFNNEEYSTDEDDNDSNFTFEFDANKRDEYFREKDEAKLEKLLKDNPELVQTKKIIELELMVLQQDGECVPSQLRTRDWAEVLTLKSKYQRRKFYKHLFINEKIQERDRIKKEERQVELIKVREERKLEKEQEIRTDAEMKYDFAHNFMLRRISNTYINTHQHWNSLKAIMFGNKIVFDCSYDSLMTNIEAKSCARQLNESYALNRAHNFPFEIILTNVNLDGHVIDTLHRQIPTLFEKDFPITVTEKSYLELFNRSSLCYLSSNAPTVLEEFDHETIYIIGAYVDKGSKKPVSFGKAKREGIRMAKLPLDKYLQFGSGGTRDLTLNQVCGIMLDAQNKSWMEAFKHVPSRKLYETRVRSLENKIKRHMMNEERQINTRYNSNNNNEEFAISGRRASNYNENFSMNRRFDSRYGNESLTDKIFTPDKNADFSHLARAKYREKWKK